MGPAGSDFTKKTGTKQGLVPGDQPDRKQALAIRVLVEGPWVLPCHRGLT